MACLVGPALGLRHLGGARPRGQRELPGVLGLLPPDPEQLLRGRQDSAGAGLPLPLAHLRIGMSAVTFQDRAQWEDVKHKTIFDAAFGVCDPRPFY